MNESELLANLTAEVEALRVLLLTIGEAITSTIKRLPAEGEPVLSLDTPLLFVTTADAEVTHADGSKE